MKLASVFTERLPKLPESYYALAVQVPATTTPASMIAAGD